MSYYYNCQFPLRLNNIFCVCAVHKNSVRLAINKLVKKSIQKMDEKEISYEPMDIDLSSNSLSAMDISYTESLLDYSKVTIKQEKDMDVTNNVCRSSSPLIIEDNLITQSLTVPRICNETRTSNYKSKWISCLTVLLLSFLTYKFSTFKCCDDLHLHTFKTVLHSRLYGQQAAIDSLIMALEPNVSKMLILYGGTGVGKTMTVSLLLENKLDYSNIYHYTMPSFLQTFSSEFMLGHTFCKSTLVVLDDVQYNDIPIIEEHFKELIDKNNKLSKVITLIIIYNCEENDNQYAYKCDNILLELRKSFQNIIIDKHYIKFNPLNEEHLKQCILNDLPNKAVSEYDLNKIVINFNVKLDGCKGVYQKMKYLNIV